MVAHVFEGADGITLGETGATLKPEGTDTLAAKKPDGTYGTLKAAMFEMSPAAGTPNSIKLSGTAPASPVDGEVWIDGSLSPPRLQYKWGGVIYSVATTGDIP